MLEAKHSVSIYQFSQNVGTKQIKLASMRMQTCHYLQNTAAAAAATLCIIDIVLTE